MGGGQGSKVPVTKAIFIVILEATFSLYANETL